MSSLSWLSAHDSQPDLPRAPPGAPGGGSCRRLEEVLNLAGVPAGANKLRKPVRSLALEARKQKKEGVGHLKLPRNLGQHNANPNHVKGFENGSPMEL